MNPTEVVKIVDHAAAASDRWMFVAMLIIFLVTIGWLTKWGMNQLEKRDARINALSDELSSVRKDHALAMVAQADRFATVVANNTAALQAFIQQQGRLEIVQPTPALKPFDPNPHAPRSIET